LKRLLSLKCKIMWKKINRFFDIIDDPIDIILIPIYTILGKIYLRIRYPSFKRKKRWSIPKWFWQ